MQSRLFIHPDSVNLGREDIVSAYKWLTKTVFPLWKDCHHFYRRHNEFQWDLFLGENHEDMNEVAGYIRTGEILRKTLISGKKPMFFKKTMVSLELKPKGKRGRPRKCQI